LQDGHEREQAEWQPEPGALHGQVWHDPHDARPTTILLVHPGTPFVRPASLDDEVAVRRVAHEYLVAVERALDLPFPGWWLPALDPDREPHPGFGWLPVFQPVDDDAPRPIASVLVEKGRSNRPTSRTLMLLAAERNGDFVLGSEFGVRVVVHDVPQTDAIARIRITGFSASLPFGDYRSEGGDDLFLNSAARAEIFRAFLDRFRDTAAAKLSLRSESTFFRGLRLGRPRGGVLSVEFKGRGLSTSDGAEPFDFILQTSAPEDFGEAILLSSHKTLLSACMGVAPNARVLRRDPASHDVPEPWTRRRPTRDEAAFVPSREFEGAQIPLQIPGMLDVVQTWYVLGDDPGAAGGGIKRVQLPNPAMPVRSNDFTAVATFRNLRQLFRFFVRFQIPRLPYFYHARLPLKAHYRSGVRPGWGKNGQTINGRVLPQGWPLDAVVAPTAADRPLLHVHLALGNLSTRARKRWNGVDRSPAEPLGFAADTRWLCHEMAHVILMATLGELELRFAHSMGDGLAAIIGDPRSSRATDGIRWRGYTFPWVFVPRRHDRCILHGWGWTGQIGRPLREVPDSERLRQKGYLTEQILSTSLFRMYRCLGGDTVNPDSGDPDLRAREQASAYAVFLIMEALRMLGNPGVVPASRVELFVAALINVDEANETETFPPGAPPANRVRWIGGCATKVISGAFQAQGMDAGAGVFHAPGLPDVDIYVQDRRDTTEMFPGAQVSHGPGSYVPVSLDWAGLIAVPPDARVPDWFAHGDAMRRTNGDMEVTVGNRGTLIAANVTVRLWHVAWPDGDPPPLWDRALWTESVNIRPPQPIPPDGAVVFPGFALPAAPGRHLVLVEAMCASDPANSDPASNLPCSRRATPLNELVPMDNNLGLTVIQVP
jgi:hypothetical protein